MKAISKLTKVCGMCSEEEAIVTVRPCGHEFCAGKVFTSELVHLVCTKTCVCS